MTDKRLEKQKQYFIAFIPPSPVYEDALKLKTYFAEQYNSKAALNSPPHITLHMPFWWKQEKEDRLIEHLRGFAKNYQPIKLCLDNFSSFPPRVIYINVINNEALDLFQKDLMRFCKVAFNLFNANYQERPYHPHLTLAFRDLKKTSYKEAWEEFGTKEYKAEFIADKLSLLRHDGKRWNVFRDFDLGSSYTTEAATELETTEG